MGLESRSDWTGGIVDAETSPDMETDVRRAKGKHKHKDGQYFSMCVCLFVCVEGKESLEAMIAMKNRMEQMFAGRRLPSSPFCIT